MSQPDPLQQFIQSLPPNLEGNRALLELVQNTTASGAPYDISEMLHKLLLAHIELTQVVVEALTWGRSGDRDKR